MKFIENIKELKKGDSLIIKDNKYFSSQGFTTIKGEVFSFDDDKKHFSIKCIERNSIDRIEIDDGKIFFIS